MDGDWSYGRSLPRAKVPMKERGYVAMGIGTTSKSVALTYVSKVDRRFDEAGGGDARTVLRLALRGDARRLRKALRKQNRHKDILNVRDKMGRTPLHISAYAGSARAASTLLEYALEDLQTRREKSLKRLKSKRRSLYLHGYSNSSKEAANEWYKDQCANIERENQFAEEREWHNMLSAADDNGWTPVHFAAQHQDPTMMRDLMHGYGVNEKSRELYESKANYDASTGEKCQRVDAVHPISLSVVHRLRRELVNAVDASGSSALHIAAASGNVEGVKILMRYGADPMLLNLDGDTPIQLAANWVTRKALRAPASPRKLRNKRTAKNISQTLRATLAYDDDVDERWGLNLQSALHVACISGDIISVEELIDAGADLDLKDANGYTALHHCQNASCAERLLENGASIDAVTNNGHTALHIAALAHEEDHEDYSLNPNVMLLVRQGADVDARTLT